MTKHECSLESTEHGFKWCNCQVTRAASVERPNGQYHVLTVNNLNIYISPQGRSIRVFKGNKELKRQERKQKVSGENQCD